MAEVFAGFVCGYAVALIFSPLLAVTLLRLRAPGNLLDRMLPSGVNLTAVAFILHGALAFFWTAVGILLGLVLLALADRPGGLCSRNLAFSFVVTAMTLAFLAPVAYTIAPLRRPLLLTGLLIVVLFGWLMPYLASWSAFGSS
jgi:hypothetical protein